MTKLKLALLCAATLAAAPAAAQQPALPDADPAIWVVKDPDTTIYLFGTFHALDGKVDWFNDEVKTAFDRANELVLELPPAKDQAVIQQVVMKHALDLEGRPLPEKLSPEARDKLRKALAELGAPPTAFDRFKPFFAAMTLAILISQKSGLTGEKGAEAVLSEAAQAASKPVSGLETFEYQLSLFDKLPETEQIKMLEETLDNLHRFPELFREMNALWSRGDAEGFAKLMIEMSAQSPAAYKLLLSDRNARWAEWIDRRLDAPGVVFVGVGAGHFGGEDNVHELLAKRGIKSARVPAE